MSVSCYSAFAKKNRGEESVYEVDKQVSLVRWTGSNFVGKHTGFISIGNGIFVTNNNEVVDGHIDLDLNTIVCNNYKNDDWNKQLVDHLKSEDFFSVEQFPNAEFELTSIEKAEKEFAYTVSGQLTIKGTTNDISFPARINVSEDKMLILGKATIDRTRWGITFGSGKFYENLAGELINDEMEVRFELIAREVKHLAAR